MFLWWKDLGVYLSHSSSYRCINWSLQRGNDLSKSRNTMGDRAWRVLTEGNSSTGWTVGLNYFMFCFYPGILWVCFLIASTVILLVFPQRSLGWGHKKGIRESSSTFSILYIDLLGKIFLEERGLGTITRFSCNISQDYIIVRNACNMPVHLSKHWSIFAARKLDEGQNLAGNACQLLAALSLPALYASPYGQPILVRQPTNVSNHFWNSSEQYSLLPFLTMVCRAVTWIVFRRKPCKHFFNKMEYT